MFLVCDFEFIGDKILESELDNIVFKDIGFNSKKTTILGKDKKYSYNYVLVPVIESFTRPKDELSYYINTSLENSTEVKQYEKDSIAEFLSISQYIEKNIGRMKLSVNFITRIDYSSFGITYADGASKMKEKLASYACCKLTEENENGVYDDFSEKKFLYEEFSGRLENGTNNIGELTGIKVSIENFSDKKYQIIISDSEYSIKCFREWIFNWKNNGFKTYSKKPISNKELIEETYNKIENSNKIVFFKWVKGHNDTTFNEICDQNAKNQLIKKEAE